MTYDTAEEVSPCCAGNIAVVEAFADCGSCVVAADTAYLRACFACAVYCAYVIAVFDGARIIADDTAESFCALNCSCVARI